MIKGAAPYGSPGIRSMRYTPAWAAFLLLWAFWLIGQLAMVPVLFLLMAPALLAGAKPDAADTGLLIILTLYLMFMAFAACALIWVRYYERRSLASAGLVRRGAIWRYGRGLFWGAAFALILAGIGALLSGWLLDQSIPGTHDFNPRLLMQPATLGVFFALTLGLLIQSAAEEIICRGWVLSSVALQYGRTTGLWASALFFGSLHVHLIVLGYINGHLLAGLAGMVAITLMGLMLGLYALGERTIAGAAGLHGAFNAVVFGLTLALILGTGQAAAPLEGVNAAYELGTRPHSLGAEELVQAALALGVSLFLWWRWRLRGKFSDNLSSPS